MSKIKSFDIDGVINLDSYGIGIQPGSPDDIIVTGRSFQEKDETLRFLHEHGIKNRVFFNPVKFDQKTREGSGWHKANVFNLMNIKKKRVHIHYEDDPIQAEIIQDNTDVYVIMVDHGNMIEMENVRRDDIEQIERIDDGTPQPIVDLFQLPYHHFSGMLGDPNGVVLYIAAGNAMQYNTLQKHFNDVIAMDTDPQHDFIKKGSIHKIPIADDLLDQVFSFETIEHINKKKQYKAMQELYRVTRSGGIIVIGSVSKYGRDAIGGYEIFKAVNGSNPHHVRELSASSFQELISSVNFYNVAYLQSYNDIHNNVAFRNSLIEDGREYCNYAVCYVGNKT